MNLSHLPTTTSEKLVWGYKEVFSTGFQEEVAPRRNTRTGQQGSWRTALAPLSVGLFFSPAPAEAQRWQASVSGFHALTAGPLLPSSQVPLTITDISTSDRAEVTGQGGRSDFQPIGPGLHEIIGASASAEGYAAAEKGAVHAYASVRAVVPPVQIAPNGPVSYSSLNAFASVTASATLRDSITFRSSTLPDGADLGLVVIGMMIDVRSNDLLGHPSFATDPVGVGAALTFGENVLTLSTAGNTTPAFQYMGASGGGFLYVGRSAIYYHAHVGETLPFILGMSAFGNVRVTEAEKQNADTVRELFVDANHTGRFYVDQLPAGVTVESASGFNYVLRNAAGMATDGLASSHLVVL